MKFSDLKFDAIDVNGEMLKYARLTLPNGFVVSVAKEDSIDSYNAAVILDDTMLITEIHGKTDTFIVADDFTFDLVDSRKVTTFIKNVEKLTKDSDFTDIKMVDDMLYIGTKYPSSDKILKIVQKIRPFKTNKNEDND